MGSSQGTNGMTKRLAISVNGGGMLGCGPLQFMCRLESDLKKSIADKAHAFGGTSTGAIIAACLSDGMNAHEVFDLYRKNLKKILINIDSLNYMLLMLSLLITKYKIIIILLLWKN